MVAVAVDGPAEVRRARGAPRGGDRRGAALADRLLELADEDAPPTPPTRAALKLPRDTDVERGIRDAAIQRGAPVARPKCRSDASRRAASTRDRRGPRRPSNRQRPSDLEVAALLREAAARGAAANVLVNLPSVGDDDGAPATEQASPSSLTRSTPAAETHEIVGERRAARADRRPVARDARPPGQRARLLEGAPIAAEIRDARRGRRRHLHAAAPATPGLPSSSSGADAPSMVYLEQILKAARRSASTAASSRSTAPRRPRPAVAAIQRLNADPLVAGIIVQMPLPPAIPLRAVIDASTRPRTSTASTRSTPAC